MCNCDYQSFPLVTRFYANTTFLVVRQDLLVSNVNGERGEKNVTPIKYLVPILKKPLLMVMDPLSGTLSNSKAFL